jgi:hypothetical protein
MRPSMQAPFAALALAILAGCGGRSVTPSAPVDQPATVIPAWVHPAGAQLIPPAPMRYESEPKYGIYASEVYGSDVLGYHNPNMGNHGPACKLYSEYVNGFAVDGRGNLLLPTAYPDEVSVYKGPALCGKLLGSFTDTYGQAADAASADALTGTIVVGDIEESGSKKVGNIAICTLAKGCTRQLKSSSITGYGGGVALAKNGDCWISSEDDSSFNSATLTYFKGCKGAGRPAHGWKNAYYGGLMIDRQGHLISIDFMTPALWVYRGCNPLCRVEHGPFKLQGTSFYGNLNAKGNEIALGDNQYGQVDVYKYSVTKLTYLYSFNTGLSASLDVESAGFSPTSKE